jgi:formylglycine-generating enzyme required for sulfatase activity
MPNEYEIRLPTEAEWIIAAKWDVKLKQMCSWSPPANEYWQNVQEVSIINNIVSPVGLFPQGVSPCGALDMAGNVWEWCSSSRNAFPMQAHVAKQNVKPSTRDLVLRGGSWKEKNKYAGWDVRSVASLPTTTLNDRGFRVFMCSRSKT